MAGYTRVDTINNIADGNVINAADLDGEFDGIQAAFNSSTGHNHDGTAGEGAPILALGPVQDVTISTTVLGVKTNNTVDLGTTGLRFKDFYLAGNASVNGTLGVSGVATFSASPVISVTDNTNAALRITQLGTGNALLVEDSANPDSTPFVIDASGVVINGYTTAVATQNYGGSAVTAALYQQHGNTQNTSTAAVFNWSSSVASPANLILNKSISNVVGTRGALTAANTDIGSVTFNGDDGTNFIPAAAILVEADGTPGTNDMPGRFLFLTTADGASTPTERMRIASTGQFTATIADMTAASPSAFYVNTTAKAAQTGSTTNILSAINTDSTFISTGTVLRNFYATQGTFAVAPITQVGFYAHSTLTGATNNYGFQGTLASATNTYNLYMSGTADNYMAGKTGIGTTPATGQILRVGGSLTGGTTARQVASVATVASDVTTRADTFLSLPATAASAFTLGILSHYHASQGTIGATSAVTTQYGFEVDNSLTGATSNYGFYGDLASGTGRWNLYMNGTASNYMAGSLFIGATTGANNKLRVQYNVSDISAASSTILADGTHTLTANNALAYGGIDGQAALNQGGFNATISLASGGSVRNRNFITVTGASGTVTAAVGSLSDVRNTGAGTLTNAAGFVTFFANSGGGIVTSTYGYYASPTTVGANNYGFYGDIASGTGRWNFYANGTADNYFAGNVWIGQTSQVWDEKLGVRLATSGSGTVGLGVYSASTTYASSMIRVQAETGGSGWKMYEGRANGGSQLFWVDGSGGAYFAGNVGIGTATPAVKLDVSGTMRSTSATITGAAGGTITPTSDTTNQYTITALGAAATIAIPSGTPIDGQKLTIRIKDNGTARALTWTTTAGGYRIIGTTLPVTTVISKTVYIGCVYNSADSFWDVVAVAQQA